MIAHVTTNFFCNYNCNYCYLGSLRKDPSIINLKTLEKQLRELDNRYGLHKIDCYGGEITLLETDYAVEVLELCKSFANTTFVTNLSNPQKASEIARRTGCAYATSVNDERDNVDETLFNLMMVEYRPNSVIQVATPSLMKKSPKEILKQAELFNTAIEAVVDMISLEKSPQAKLAKDISAGAVLVLAIASAIIGLIIFIPKFIALF